MSLSSPVVPRAETHSKAAPVSASGTPGTGVTALLRLLTHSSAWRLDPRPPGTLPKFAGRARLRDTLVSAHHNGSCLRVVTAQLAPTAWGSPQRDCERHVRYAHPRPASSLH